LCHPAIAPRPFLQNQMSLNQPEVGKVEGTGPKFSQG
jgi:hypothetical protein